MAETSGGRSINWGSAVIAGLLGTVVITITLALSGTNIMKMLGGMMLGAGAGVVGQYIAGGLMHLIFFSVLTKGGCYEKFNTVSRFVFVNSCGIDFTGKNK